MKTCRVGIGVTEMRKENTRGRRSRGRREFPRVIGIARRGEDRGVKKERKMQRGGMGRGRAELLLKNRPVHWKTI
jgi:hypothetical protein